MTTIAMKPKPIELAPLQPEAGIDTAFDADHEAHARPLEI